jgi:hypothetical protein
LAFGLGIAFQYFSIAPMRGFGVGEGIVAALKADTLSLTAFEIGLFGWMAVIQLALFTSPHLKPDHVAYWFLMQIGMIFGFLTAFPVNVWLIRRGIKAARQRRLVVEPTPVRSASLGWRQVRGGGAWRDQTAGHQHDRSGAAKTRRADRQSCGA